MRGQVAPWDGGGIAEDFGIVDFVTVAGDGTVTVTHKLGRAPLFATANVTAPGYFCGYVSGTDTTAKFWVSHHSGGSVVGSTFILVWLVK